VVVSHTPVAATDPRQRARVDDLRIEIVHLASLTVDAVVSATAALAEHDAVQADAVIRDDDAVDTLRHSIEDECLRILGRSGLAPDDLRFVGVAMRVAHELERSADLMVNVAKTTHRLGDTALDPRSRHLVQRLGRQGAVQLRVAVNAFVDRDPSWAAALEDMDETIDELEKSMFRHVLEDQSARATDEETSVLQAVQLALVARHYERVGDHAVSIAQHVHFVVTGEHSRHRRRRR
jgi:phosphate transport system protein